MTELEMRIRLSQIALDLHNYAYRPVIETAEENEKSVGKFLAFRIEELDLIDKLNKRKKKHEQQTTK